MLQALRSKLEYGPEPTARDPVRPVPGLETSGSSAGPRSTGGTTEAACAAAEGVWPQTKLQPTSAFPGNTLSTKRSHSVPLQARHQGDPLVSSAGNWQELRTALSSDTRGVLEEKADEEMRTSTFWGDEHFEEDLNIALAALTTASTLSSCTLSRSQELPAEAAEFTSRLIPPKWSSLSGILGPQEELQSRAGQHSSALAHSIISHPQPAPCSRSCSPLPSPRQGDNESELSLQLHLPPTPSSPGRQPPTPAAPPSPPRAAPARCYALGVDASAHPESDPLYKSASAQSFWEGHAEAPSTPQRPSAAAPQPAASPPVGTSSQSAPVTPAQPAPQAPRESAASPSATPAWCQPIEQIRQAAQAQLSSPPSFPQQSIYDTAPCLRYAHLSRPMAQQPVPGHASQHSSTPARNPSDTFAAAQLPDSAVPPFVWRPDGMPGDAQAAAPSGPRHSHSPPRPELQLASPDSQHHAPHAGDIQQRPSPRAAPPAAPRSLAEPEQRDLHEPRQPGSRVSASAQPRQHAAWLRSPQKAAGQGIMHTHSTLEQFRRPRRQHEQVPSIMQTCSSLEQMRRPRAEPCAGTIFERRSLHATSSTGQRMQAFGHAGPSDSVASLGPSLRPSPSPEHAAGGLSEPHTRGSLHPQASQRQPPAQTQPYRSEARHKYHLRPDHSAKQLPRGLKAEPKVVRGSAAEYLASPRHPSQPRKRPGFFEHQHQQHYQQQQQQGTGSAFHDAHTHASSSLDSSQDQGYHTTAASGRSGKPGVKDCHIWLADGSCYSGRGEGLGVCTWHTGNQFQGSFHDGQIQGLGVFRFRAGGEYAGQWRSGRFAGLGMERFADGTLFIGDYEDGLADGSGVAIYLDGSMHEGQFAAGKPHGRGLHKGGDGSISVGLYVDGCREGLVAHDLPNGDRYAGTWAADKPEGHGCLSSLNGTLYKGDFCGGLRHGWGVLSSPAGQPVCGFWQQGRKMWAQAYPTLGLMASRRHSRHPMEAEEAESCDLALHAAELACAAADEAMELVYAHPKEVRKLAKQAAVDAREAALAAEEVQCMAAQLAARHAPTALEAGPPVCDRVGDIHALVQRLSSASTPLPA